MNENTAEKFIGNLPNLGIEGPRPKIVVLTGAGVSKESGLGTFRESGGLWEKYRVEEVATPEAWAANPKKVLEFYNQRRLQLGEVSPNEAHFALAKLERDYDVSIVTQNVDDLHERAGSANILHLHGELVKVRSTRDGDLIYNIGVKEIQYGDLCDLGSQLRPHIVWFGEEVPKILEASKICNSADAMIIIGTSLEVYPAAGLVYELKENTPVVLIDPNDVSVRPNVNVMHMREKASVGAKNLVSKMLGEL